MAKGFQDLAANPESAALDHAEWLGLLLEHEVTLRQQKRFESRARTAKLRQAATVEDVDFRTPRGLDRTLFMKLASCDWIREHRHRLLTGPCGVGKSWLACALGHKACRENLSVLYHRMPRLFAPWPWPAAMAATPGCCVSSPASTSSSSTTGDPSRCSPEQRRDLLEIVEDRYDAGSLIITSQLPVDRWYEIVGNPTLADAILDRLVHNAYRIELTGESLRKPRASA